jgi:EmrB/QacA subfamily drug resistance transporter
LEQTGEVDAAAGQGFAWSRSRVIVLVVLCLAPLLEYVDMTVVNVALPVIRADLGFALPDLQSVINAYTICFGRFFLFAGRAGDLFGRRRVFLGGVAAFTVASLASGLAPGPGLLTGARAVQGLAAAFVVPLTLAMIAAEFPEGKPRNIALTAWGTITAISASLGLVADGLLVTGPGCRWIFYVNLPIGALILVASWRYLRDDRPARRHREFDMAAAVTSTAGLGLLTYAVVQAGTHPWHSARTIGLRAGSGALLGYFVIHELRFAGEPLLSFSLLRNRAVSGANTAPALSGAGLVSVFYFATLYQQQVLHYSALQTGLAYLPLTGVFMVEAGLGRSSSPGSGIRYVTAAGALISAGSLLALTRITPDGTLLGSVILPTMIFGAGLAVFYIPMTVAAVYRVPPERTGVASALVNVTRTVGGAVGLAVISTVVTSRISHEAASGHPAGDALSGAFRLAFMITAALLAAAAVFALAVFRDEGRGEQINLAEITRAGIEA